MTDYRKCIGETEAEISIDTLRQLVTLDPETAQISWLARSLDWFPSHAAMRRWNGRFAGKTAFHISDGRYFCGTILWKRLSAHRVIWALTYGEWPSCRIDHINGNGFDNRICNLRLVSHTDNLRNSKRRSDNSSGQVGVYLHSKTNQWRAAIGCEGKTIQLGGYSSKEEAILVRKNAEAKFGFHENHGRASL